MQHSTPQMSWKRSQCRFETLRKSARDLELVYNNVRMRV